MENSRMPEKLQKLFEEIKERGKQVSFVYYSPFAKQGFCVKIYDKDGKPKIKTHPVTGVPLMSGSNYIFMEKDEDFDTIAQARTSKNDCLSIKQVKSDEFGNFTDYQKELILTLENLADDPKNHIVRESEYKLKTNPEAYSVEKKMKELERENDNLKAGTKKMIQEATEEIKENAKNEIERLKEKYEAELKEIRSKKKGK